jgi:hypothetical protein
MARTFSKTKQNKIKISFDNYSEDLIEDSKK